MTYMAAAILGGAALSAGGSLASGLIGANAATTAANDQSQAAMLNNLIQQKVKSVFHR